MGWVVWEGWDGKGGMGYVHKNRNKMNTNLINSNTLAYLLPECSPV